MGSYTNYSLEVNIGYAEDHEDKINKMFEEDSCLGEDCDSCKWYSYAEDMKKYSLLHPKILFTVVCDGEEDIWKHYFKNGEEQLAEAVITYPPPNFPEEPKDETDPIYYTNM